MITDADKIAGEILVHYQRCIALHERTSCQGSVIVAFGFEGQPQKIEVLIFERVGQLVREDDPVLRVVQGLAAKGKQFLAMLVVERADLFAEQAEVRFFQVQPVRQQSQRCQRNRRVPEFLIRNLLDEFLAQDFRELRAWNLAIFTGRRKGRLRNRRSRLARSSALRDGIRGRNVLRPLLRASSNLLRPSVLPRRRS